jgi:hypothetical protein
VIVDSRGALAAKMVRGHGWAHQFWMIAGVPRTWR